YEQISADQPDFPFAHIKRGELLEQQQDMDAALDAFRTAAEIAPENADVQFTLAYALRRAGLTDEAIAAFEAGLALDPGRQAAQDALDALRAGS
ncbi:MAG: tetratricopeptide repeat protein, partial [Anaerolineae bacterium]|nr:tetratricopeptide repeat protein [Anaerolineae bacterium]